MEQESKNPLKSEHLKEGVSPIMAAIGTPEQFSAYPGAEKEIFENAQSNRSENRNVDYYGESARLTEQKFKNAGKYSYVISPVDSANKFSKSYLNCTGLVVAGRDKETGKNISVLSHQDPNYFLTQKNAQGSFEKDLRERLNELKERCEEGTVDAVVVGGNYFKDLPKLQENYLKSIKLLSSEASEILGFEPVVITGPKTESVGEESVFYDNDHRRLYIIRPRVGKTSTESYIPSKIKDQEQKW